MIKAKSIFGYYLAPVKSSLVPIFRLVLGFFEKFQAPFLDCILYICQGDRGSNSSAYLEELLKIILPITGNSKKEEINGSHGIL